MFRKGVRKADDKILVGLRRLGSPTSIQGSVTVNPSPAVRRDEPLCRRSGVDQGKPSRSQVIGCQRCRAQRSKSSGSDHLCEGEGLDI